MSLIEFDAGVFFLVEPSGGIILPGHVVGPGASQFPRDVRLTLDQKLSGWVAANNKTITNLPPTPDFESSPNLNPGYSMSAIAPIVYGGNVLGAISLYRTSKEKFSDTECRHLEIVAGQTAVALDRIPADGDSHTTLFDEITGLPNGYQLFLMFDQVAVDSVRHDYPLTLLAYRLENLTDVRRKYGHVSSNSLVRVVSSYVAMEVRDSDILVRYAEDLFVSLHPRMTREQAEALKVRVQNQLDSERVTVRHGVGLPASVSVGIAGYPSNGRDLQEILGVLDWQLNDDQSARRDKPLRFPPQKSQL